jgi:tetrahydromethanopterin S-methyltransferase subunit G
LHARGPDERVENPEFGVAIGIVIGIVVVVVIVVVIVFFK